MSRIRKSWVNVAAAVLGGFTLAFGLGKMYFGLSLAAAVWAVFGFLVLGWAIFDARKFRRGTPESEVGGGRTIE